MICVLPLSEVGFWGQPVLRMGTSNSPNEFTKLHIAARKIPPLTRRRISSEYTPYPVKVKRSFQDGVRSGAKRMKQAQQVTNEQAIPFILQAVER